MGNDTQDTEDRARLLTDYAIKLFGTEAGTPHREHFMIAAESDDGQLVTSACCPIGLVQIVLAIITTRPDRTELIDGPAGEKGN